VYLLYVLYVLYVLFVPYHFVCNRRLVAYQIDALMWKRRLPAQMANRECRMENGEWWMGNGKWRMRQTGQTGRKGHATDKFVRRPHDLDANFC